jgi:hypothetical protein
MFGQGSGVYTSLLLGGKGVKFATNTVDTARNVVCTAMGGTLEERVLYEMGNTFVGTRLMPTTDPDVDTGVDHARGGVAEYYAYAVRQSVIFVQKS